jgi:hypothetical protein
VYREGIFTVMEGTPRPANCTAAASEVM